MFLIGHKLTNKKLLERFIDKYLEFKITCCCQCQHGFAEMAWQWKAEVKQNHFIYPFKRFVL